MGEKEKAEKLINFSHKTEEELISFCQRGYRQAFDELIVRDGNYIKMWILKYCKGNDSLADEIFSQTIIKCWQKIKTFKGESKFSTWANCIARRNFLDEYRKSTRYELVNLDNCSNLTSVESKNPDDVKFFAETHPEYSKVDNSSPSSKVETLEAFNESKDLVSKVMNRLNYNDRNILRLYHYDNLEYKQISKMLRIPVGTVMSRLFYARRKACRILKLLKK